MQLSSSKLKAFAACEADAYATYVAKTQVSKATEAKALGSLFDAIMTKGYKHDLEAKVNPQILQQALASPYGDGSDTMELLLTKKGEFTAAASRIITNAPRLLNDPTVQELMSGAEFQKELKFQLCGHEARAFLDLYNPNFRGAPIIIDIKKVGQMETWADVEDTNGAVRSRKLAWYDAFDYWFQLAVYKHAMGNPKGSRTGLLYMTEDAVAGLGLKLINAPIRCMLAQAEVLIERIDELIEAKGEGARRCGLCEYCRKTSTVNFAEEDTVDPVFRSAIAKEAFLQD